MIATQLPGLPVVDSIAFPAESVATVPSGTCQDASGQKFDVWSHEASSEPVAFSSSVPAWLAAAPTGTGDEGGGDEGDVATCTPISPAAATATTAAPPYASFTRGGSDGFLFLAGCAACLLRTAIEESIPLFARER
jgi:hypothetical protein